MNKYELVGHLVAQRVGSTASVLDVGCRDCVLRRYLATEVRYEGVDLYQNDEGTVAHVLDVEAGLPFADGAYDVTTALDLLEHLNGFQRGLDELVRIARRQVHIVLPNTSNIFFRIDYLRHGYFRRTSKYDLKLDAGQDRHRWLTPLAQTDSYLQAYSQRAGLTLERYPIPLGSPKRWGAGGILRAVGFPESWWVWNTLYVLSK